MPLWEPNNNMVETLSDRWAEDVFDETKQRKYIQPDAFKKFRTMLNNGQHSLIDNALASQVAAGMKTWAVSKGATHFTHWFQPLSGVTAEKHDSFMGRSDPCGNPLMDYKGDLLTRGEPDGSSFPTGGLRNTAEARGYTLWDPMSPAFLIHYEYGAVLYIPCAFLAWGSDALDTKTPLLKSEEALSEACIELLNLIGDNSARVNSTLGVEQEFFIIDREKFKKRPDLYMSGRTLQGRAPPKGQELDDHYFGSIPRKVTALLQDIEVQCWRLGIPLTTRHNEVAPAQHEFAPVFEYMSVATDHQLLLMAVMKAKAREHGLEALFHEKPFAGLNGTGKHNNWSMSTNLGTNLLAPPDELLTDSKKAFSNLENTRFTTILAAVIKAVDEHAGALRCSIASAGQDLRLGANEAPPAIISVYLGKSLKDVMDNLCGKPVSPSDIKLAEGEGTKIAARLPVLKEDHTDRNRTSSFAFTGNKFEFRAVGGPANCAIPMTAVQSATACAIRDMSAQIKEKMAKGMKAHEACVQVTTETFKKHSRVVFDGDGYADSWPIEAAKLGLPNFSSTPKALIGADQETIYTRTKVMKADECNARINVALENYIKTKQIEAKCLVMMSGAYFEPAAQQALARMGASQAAAKTKVTTRKIERLAALLETIGSSAEKMEGQLAHEESDLKKEATFMDDVVNVTMAEMRVAADELEGLCTPEEWKLPTYSEMIFIQHE